MKILRVPKATPTRTIADIDADLATLAGIVERHAKGLTPEEQADLDRIQGEEPDPPGRRLGGGLMEDED